MCNDQKNIELSFFEYDNIETMTKMEHIKANLFIARICIIKIQRRKSKTKYTESIKKEDTEGIYLQIDRFFV